MRRITALLVFLVFFTGASHAGEAEIAQCVNLAREIAVGESESFTSSELDAMKYFASCEASQSGSKSSLNIGYGAFSLGGGYDEAEAKQLCKKTREELGISITEYNKSKIFFARALDTIDKCLTAATQNWNVNYQRVQRDAVTIGLSNTGELGGKLRQITIVPESAMKCQGMPSTFPVLVTASDPINLTCARTPENQVVNGVTVESSKEATVILQLGANPLPITLPAYHGSIFDSMNEQVRVMQNAIGKLQADAISLRRDSGTETSLVSGGVQKCPAGQVVVGVQGIDTDGGKFCTSCISQIRIFCRPVVD